MNLECIICAESFDKGPLYKSCNCNTLIHKECLIKLVNVKSHQQRCAICLKEYNMIITERKKVYTIHICQALIFILIYLTSLSVFLLSILLILNFKSNFEYIYIFAGIIILLSIGLIIFIHYYYYKKTGRICWIIKKINIKKQLILPSPIINSIE